jgi:hypothetical protein
LDNPTQHERRWNIADTRRVIMEETGIKRQLASLAGNATRLEALSKETRITLRRLQQLANGAKPTNDELKALSRVYPGAPGSEW